MIKLKKLIESRYNEIVAFHASPHDIKGSFKIEKIGSGEGSATFGWGFYFAENPKTADSYKKSLAVYTLDGIELRDYIKRQNFPRNAMDLAHREGINIHDATEEWDEIAPTMMALDHLITYDAEADYMLSVSNSRYAKEARDLIFRWERDKRLKSTSHVYVVNIDAELDELLDWFMPMEEQGDKIQKAVAHLPNVAPTTTGQELYRFLGGLSNTKRGASEQLRKLGIKGIKYSDKGSRKHPEGGTYNFVVFDPSLIHITNKDGKPVTPEQAEKENSVLQVT